MTGLLFSVFYWYLMLSIGIVIIIIRAVVHVNDGVAYSLFLEDLALLVSLIFLLYCIRKVENSRPEYGGMKIVSKNIFLRIYFLTLILLYTFSVSSFTYWLSEGETFLEFFCFYWSCTSRFFPILFSCYDS